MAHTGLIGWLIVSYNGFIQFHNGLIVGSLGLIVTHRMAHRLAHNVS